MKAKKLESWEKQDIYRLENGWKATVEYNNGSFVSRLDHPNGINYWHCSNGTKAEIANGAKNAIPLPDFARPWLEEVMEGCRLVRTKHFEY